MNDGSAGLRDRGYWVTEGDFGSCDEALETADGLVAMHCAAGGIEPLPVIGDFVIPPPGGPEGRDFQTLHFDFGLPLNPTVVQDVARYTALYVARSVADVSAITRLVPLVALLGQRDWPQRSELLDSFIAYGLTHGAWDDSRGYSEGSLARVIEAAAGIAPLLPSVKAHPDFLCGMEFDTPGAELAFFQRHGLEVEDVAIDIALRPGQLLLFDNLALAHGRLGRRLPGELHQRIFGHQQLSPVEQLEVRERVLSAFYTFSPDGGAAVSTVSIP